MTRNKTLIKGFALATLLPLFAACSSEDDAIVQGGEPQEVQVSIGTRATTDGDTWTWENNDVIGLNVTGYNGTSSSYTCYAARHYHGMVSGGQCYNDCYIFQHSRRPKHRCKIM